MSQRDIQSRILKHIQNLKIPPIGNLIPFQYNIDLHVLEVLVLVRIHIDRNFQLLSRSPVNNT